MSVPIIEPPWLAVRPAPFAAPPGVLQADVAIIGGGLTGLSTALHLLRRRPGLRVVVLEAGRIGSGASGRTTGMIGPGVGQDVLGLVRRLGVATAGALYNATVQAVEDTINLIREEGIACELDLCGQLLIARTAAGRARLRAQAEVLALLGHPADVLDDHELAARVCLRQSPAQSASAARRGPAALRLARAGTLHPVRLLAGLVEAVLRRGGVIHEGADVQEVDGRRNGTARLVLAGGEVHAAQVVVATAGYSARLGVLRGRVLPVHLQVLCTERLSAASLAALGWPAREGVRDVRRVFHYFRLTSEDRLIFGGGAPRYCWGGQVQDGDAGRALAALAAEMGATFPAAAALRVAGGWTGVIGYLIDALPAIAPWRGGAGVWHAVGWCGHGVALATAAGAWMTRLLCDGAAPEDLPWYRDNPPGVPGEALRWLGFRATVGAMGLLDRFA